MKVKAHLVIPKEILEEVDHIAGKRGRSLYIAEAAQEKLERERFLKLLEETKGWDSRHPDLKPPKIWRGIWGGKEGPCKKGGTVSQFELRHQPFPPDSDVIIWHLRGREEVTGMLRVLQRYGLPRCSAISILEVEIGMRKMKRRKQKGF